MKYLVRTLAALCLIPVLTHAAEGVVVDDVSLQTGPDPEYPPVSQLSAGTEVSIQGCIDQYSWCDVIAGGDRGWVPGTYLEESYDNQQVIVTDYGPRIGIPIVAFSLGVYWDQHYRERRWYGERQQWESRHFAYHAPPRPARASQARAAQHEDRSREHANDRGHQAVPAQPVVQQPQHETKPKPEAASREPALRTPQQQQSANQQPARSASQAERTAAQPPHRPVVNPALPASSQEQGKAAPLEHRAAQNPAPKAEPKAQPKNEQGKKDEAEHKDKDGGH